MCEILLDFDWNKGSLFNKSIALFSFDKFFFFLSGTLKEVKLVLSAWILIGWIEDPVVDC